MHTIRQLLNILSNNSNVDATKTYSSKISKYTIQQQLNILANSIQPAPTLQELDVTDNGVYEPETGIDGYNKVVVEVPDPEVKTLEVTSNGIYKAEDEDVFGFDEVQVQVDGSNETIIYNYISSVSSTQTYFQNGTYQKILNGNAGDTLTFKGISGVLPYGCTANTNFKSITYPSEYSISTTSDYSFVGLLNNNTNLETVINFGYIFTALSSYIASGILQARNSSKLYITETIKLDNRKNRWFSSANYGVFGSNQYGNYAPPKIAAIEIVNNFVGSFCKDGNDGSYITNAASKIESITFGENAVANNQDIDLTGTIMDVTSLFNFIVSVPSGSSFTLTLTNHTEELTDLDKQLLEEVATNKGVTLVGL